MRRSVAIAVASLASIVIALVASLLGVAPVHADTPGTDTPSRGPHDSLELTYRHYAVETTWSSRGCPVRSARSWRRSDRGR